MSNPDYAEFGNPRLAKIYDSFNFLTDDESFWLKIVKELPIESVVDLGCGTGLLTTKLAKLGYKTIGIEPAPSMLKLAKEKPHADLVEWIEGSYEKLAEEKADLVIMTSHVAQFFLDESVWLAAVQRIYESLKPGGYIFFDSKNSSLEPWTKWTRELSSKIANTPLGEVESWVELKQINDNRVQYEIHYLFLDNQEKLISKNELVYRTQSELMRDLENASFRIEKVYGNWDASAFDEKSSPEMIFLAEK